MVGYAYAVARVRALETRLLERGQWERLIGADTPEEVWRILGETVYAQKMENRAYHQYEDVFWEELATTADFLRGVVAEQSFLAKYLFRHELHNIKVSLLSKLTGFQGRMTPVSPYSAEKREAIFEAPQWFKGELLAKMAKEFCEREFLDAQDLQRSVDNEYYRYMAKQKEEFTPFLQKFWSDLVELTNLRLLLRVKQMGEGAEFLSSSLLPGGTVPEKEFLSALNWSEEEIKNWWLWKPTGRALLDIESLRSLWRLEKTANDYLTQSLRVTARQAFGEEPLVAFFWNKENEIRKLRIIMAAKINKLPVEEWRERI